MNPFRGGLSAREQMVAKMFWMIKEPIRKFFELTVPLRATDEWLKASLEADRAAAEPWEIHCFIHGLPTRNPGSWLPQLNGPSCGNVACKELAEESHGSETRTIKYLGR